ncbi:hypothetical protein BdWA1_000927 [Babesia duncani]|uniref:Uncharacterized protein n=1 Tax=Babesia duncani TaxID=323732 RepID=A0AAD9PN26_9APIC|nr:hypothetical protein BdWA1_000927 [Babesia duncani]
MSGSVRRSGYASSRYTAHSNSRMEPPKEPPKTSSKDVNPESYGSREKRKERSKQSNRHDESSKDSSKNESPNLLKAEPNVDNEELFAGLAWQRQCDEKPDIDTLTNSLLQMYNDITSGVEGALENTELMDRIFLTALRVKARTESQMNACFWRMLSTVRYGNHLVLKHRSIELNLPRADAAYITTCKDYRRTTAYNEHYEKLSKVVTKIPSIKQLNDTIEEMTEKRDKIMANIHECSKQIAECKSQIEMACKDIGIENN